MDLRGHGKSSTDNDLDLSIEVKIILRSKTQQLFDFVHKFVMYVLFLTIVFLILPYVFTFQTLCNDVIALIKTMYGDSPPAIILVGHRSLLYFIFHILYFIT
jgi:protein phosphatase methylesterase 1